MRSKRFITGFCTVSILIMMLSQNVIAQQYAQVKVWTKSGSMFTGRKGTIDGNILTYLSGGQAKTIPLDDIQMIRAKEGKAGKYAAGCGGGCGAICLAIIIAGGTEDEEGETGPLIISSIFWTAVSGGIGYVIGLLTDPWETVYVSGYQSSISKPLQLGMGIKQNGAVTVGLSYHF
ncbi:hypothetical protein JW835_15205 [bacterium]|nr:hypothetical protein [bacterium]